MRPAESAGLSLAFTLGLACVVSAGSVAGRVEVVKASAIEAAVPAEAATRIRPGDVGYVIEASGERIAKLEVTAVDGTRVSARILRSTKAVTVGLAVSFEASGAGRMSAVEPPRPQTTAGGNQDAVACEALKTSRTAAAFQAYLKRYPNGKCAGLAEIRLAELGQSPPGSGSGQAVQSTPRAGQGATNRKDGLEYVWIPPGTFQMGCVPSDGECAGDEKPRHAVTLSRGFWMGKTEVTVGAFRRYVSASGSGMPPAPGFGQGEDHPVVNVEWNGAKAFCEWGGGRLPTEAEWEYAVRGGREGTKYPWGDTISHENANYGKDQCCGGLATGRDQWERTSPAGSFAANGFGLFDVAGNVWEWCADVYDGGFYGRSPGTEPRNESGGTARVLRGGSWNDYPWDVRASNRSRYLPGDGLDYIGLRCARDAAP